MKRRELNTANYADPWGDEAEYAAWLTTLTEEDWAEAEYFRGEGLNLEGIQDQMGKGEA